MIHLEYDFDYSVSASVCSQFYKEWIIEVKDIEKEIRDSMGDNYRYLYILKWTSKNFFKNFAEKRRSLIEKFEKMNEEEIKKTNQRKADQLHSAVLEKTCKVFDIEREKLKEKMESFDVLILLEKGFDLKYLFSKCVEEIDFKFYKRGDQILEDSRSFETLNDKESEFVPIMIAPKMVDQKQRVLCQGYSYYCPKLITEIEMSKTNSHNNLVVPQKTLQPIKPEKFQQHNKENFNNNDQNKNIEIVQQKTPYQYSIPNYQQKTLQNTSNQPIYQENSSKTRLSFSNNQNSTQIKPQNSNFNQPIQTNHQETSPRVQANIEISIKSNNLYNTFDNKNKDDDESCCKCWKTNCAIL